MSLSEPLVAAAGSSFLNTDMTPSTEEQARDRAGLVTAAAAVSRRSRINHCSAVDTRSAQER